MEDVLLELKNIELIYHTNKAEIKALENVSFKVKKGEFVAIVGPSGCGKTTILSIISGLLSQTNGKVFIDGEERKKLDAENVGYMFQRDHLFEWRTVWQNVILGFEIKHSLTEENKKYVRDLINKYGLENFINSKPRELSGGMRQRVALIRTLATKPKLLLLDEPFSALDYQTRLNVCEDVGNIIKTEKQTVVLITHDIAEAVSLADRVIVLSKRPAVVKTEFIIDITETSPLKRREDKKFVFYFDKIWKELSNEK